MKPINGSLLKQIRHRLEGKNSVAILQSLIAKPLGLLTGFLITSTLFEILGSDKYGYWIAVSSFVGWISLFDFGLGHEMRNRLAAFKSNEIKERNITINETYSKVIVLTATIGALLLVLLNLVGLENIFNIKAEYLYEFKNAFWILLLYVILMLNLKLIYSVFHAIGKTGWVTIIDSIVLAVQLFCIYIYSFVTQEYSLIELSSVFTIPVVLVMIFFNRFFFKSNKWGIKPPRISLDKLASKGTGIGKDFFIIQISFLLLYQTDNLIVLNAIDSSTVSNYYLMVKYSSIMFLFHQLIVSPFWSSVTTDLADENFDNIKTTFYRLLNLTLIFGAVQLLLWLAADTVYLYWLPSFKLNKVLLFFVMFSYWVMMWNNLVSTFLNGLGVLKVQRFTAIFSALLNVPLTYLGALKFGLIGVIISTGSVYLFSGILNYWSLRLQLRRL